MNMESSSLYLAIAELFLRLDSALSNVKFSLFLCEY